MVDDCQKPERKTDEHLPQGDRTGWLTQKASSRRLQYV